MWRSRWRCVIKPAYSVSFLLSINIFVWQNVLYFPNDPRISICIDNWQSKPVSLHSQISIFTLLFVYSVVLLATLHSRWLHCNRTAGAELYWQFSDVNSTPLHPLFFSLQRNAFQFSWAVLFQLLCLFLRECVSVVGRRYTSWCGCCTGMQHAHCVLQVAVRRTQDGVLWCQGWERVVGWRDRHACGRGSWSGTECFGLWQHSFGRCGLLPAVVESEVSCVLSYIQSISLL